MQDSPLSPVLYNLATDFINEDLSDPQIPSTYGYSISD